jgi:hypothetical protein
MSDKDTNTDPNINLPAMPPLGQVGGGGYTLLPTVKLPKRTAKGRTQEVGDIPAEDIISTSKGNQEFVYVGQNLVNASGVISRGQYSEDEAYSELASRSPAERRELQNLLYSVGAYGSSKPSRSGFNSADFSAVREAMLYANSKGVTLDVARSMMVTELGGGVGGGGKRIRTTPKQDLQTVFRQVSGQVLGRRLSDSEVEKFVRAYNQREISEAYGGEAAPQADVAAMAQIESAVPEEAGAVGMLKLSNVIDSAIKELG